MPAAGAIEALGGRPHIDGGVRFDYGPMNAAASYAQRLSDPAVWAEFGVDHADTSVAIGSGCGPAAQLVRTGRVTRAILIDPDFTALTRQHPDAITDLVAQSDEPTPAFRKLAAEIAERLEPFGDRMEAGDFTPEMIDIMFGAFTGEPYRVMQARIATEFWLTSANLAAHGQQPPAELEASDWASPATEFTDRIDLWFTGENHTMADVVAARTGVAVTKQPWPPAAWLTEPDTVARCIAAT